VLPLIANAVQNAMVGPDRSLTGGVLAAAVLLILNAAVAPAALALAPAAAHVLRRVRRPSAKAGAGQNHRRVDALSVIMSVTDCAPGGPQRSDGLCEKKAGGRESNSWPWPGL